MVQKQDLRESRCLSWAELNGVSATERRESIAKPLLWKCWKFGQAREKKEAINLLLSLKNALGFATELLRIEREIRSMRLASSR